METQNTQNMQNAENVENTQNATNNANEQNMSQNPYIVQNSNNNQNATTNSFFSSLNNDDFIKGALIGAAIGYVLTNEKAQKTIMKTVAKGTQMFQMGVEEIKERFEDVKAEMGQ